MKFNGFVCEVFKERKAELKQKKTLLIREIINSITAEIKLLARPPDQSSCHANFLDKWLWLNLGSPSDIVSLLFVISMGKAKLHRYKADCATHHVFCIHT